MPLFYRVTIKKIALQVHFFGYDKYIPNAITYLVA